MRIFLFVSVILLASCQKEEPSVAVEPAPTLVGTWQSELMDGEWGESYLVTTYFSDGRVAGAVSYTDAGEIAWSGTYTTHENVIRRTIEGDTQESTYRIEGGVLHQSFGDEKYTFKRVPERE